MGDLVPFASVDGLLRMAHRRIFAASSHGEVEAIRAELPTWQGLTPEHVAALDALIDFQQQEIDRAAADARERDIRDAYQAVCAEFDGTGDAA